MAAVKTSKSKAKQPSKSAEKSKNKKKTVVTRDSPSFPVLPPVCFVDKTHLHRTKFVSEIPVKEIPFTAGMLKNFPKGLLPNRKLRITNIGSYSFAVRDISVAICNILERNHGCNSKTHVTDATANVGGMTIAFAQRYAHVTACEIVPMHCDMLKHNISAYGLTDKTTIHCGDYLDAVHVYKQDVVFFDPPWGGTDYKRQHTIDLHLSNVNVWCLAQYLMTNDLAKLVVVRVPNNTDFQTLNSIVTACNFASYVLTPNQRLIVFFKLHLQK